MRAAFEKLSGTEFGAFVAKKFALRAFDHSYHFHPEFELTYIESSSGRRFVGDSIETFAPGDLVLLGSNLPHLYYSDPRDSMGEGWAKATVIQFKANVFGERFFDLPDLAPLKTLLGSAARGLCFGGKARASVAPLMGDLCDRHGPERVIGLIDALHRLTGHKGRSLSSRRFRPDFRHSDMERIDRVVAFVHRNFEDEIFLAEVAKVAALTPEAFCRFFKRATGRTFSRFVNEVRIAEACRLLSETNRTISDIAFSCGFGALSHFNQRFAQLKEMTPRDYRTAVRAASGGSV